MYPFTSKLQICSGVSYFSMISTSTFSISLAIIFSKNIVLCLCQYRTIVSPMSEPQYQTCELCVIIYLFIYLDTILLCFCRVNRIQPNKVWLMEIIFCLGILRNFDRVTLLISFSGTHFEDTYFI